MASTDMEAREDLTPVLSEAEEQALADEIKGDVAPSDIVVPQLKLAQGQSREVQAGLVDPGEFVNSLTGESFGTEIEFVVADHFKGRFWSTDDGNGRGAQGDVVPWSDHPCYGRHFADCPDAEEVYSDAVNNGEKEWGKGPPISTTTNFVGFVVGENGSPVPVRLSLMRTNNDAARKLLTFISRLSKAPWDNVYTIKSVRREKGRNAFHVVEVERGRTTTPVERNETVKLAVALRSADKAVEYTEDPEATGEATPKSDERKGGLEV